MDLGVLRLESHSFMCCLKSALELLNCMASSSLSDGSVGIGGKDRVLHSGLWLIK